MTQDREPTGLYCEWCGEPLVCSGCGGAPKSWGTTKPIAGIRQTGEHYYVLSMGDREMGGKSRARLKAYAQKLGYKVVAE